MKSLESALRRDEVEPFLLDGGSWQELRDAGGDDYDTRPYQIHVPGGHHGRRKDLSYTLMPRFDANAPIVKAYDNSTEAMIQYEAGRYLHDKLGGRDDGGEVFAPEMYSFVQGDTASYVAMQYLPDMHSVGNPGFYDAFGAEASELYESVPRLVNKTARRKLGAVGSRLVNDIGSRGNNRSNMMVGMDRRVALIDQPSVISLIDRKMAQAVLRTVTRR